MKNFWKIFGYVKNLLNPHRFSQLHTQLLLNLFQNKLDKKERPNFAHLDSLSPFFFFFRQKILNPLESSLKTFPQSNCLNLAPQIFGSFCFSCLLKKVVACLVPVRQGNDLVSKLYSNKFL